MKNFNNPGRAEWHSIGRRSEINQEFLRSSMINIIDRVRKGGDASVLEFTEEFDKVKLKSLIVSEDEIKTAKEEVPRDLKDAIALAYNNIKQFHSSQLSPSTVIETTPGVRCWRKPMPIDKVGIYVPGGTAPLFSSVLMMAIPATIAGCKEIILCSPPDKHGNIHPAILYSAELCGLHQIFKVGGAQAIAAMSTGTESIPSVDKIFGPGNQYVTAAKQIVNEMGTAIDMPAGPSELAILADSSADPAFLAADLLSQAEHGADSQVMLVSTDSDLGQKVNKELKAQIEILPRKKMAADALMNSKSVYFDDMKAALEFVNFYAPEHLIIQCTGEEDIAREIRNAGSVFLGLYTPESAGDYASGTNHTLPTNRHARAYSGLSTESFVKYITFQMISKQGLENLGPAIETMAEAERLQAHKNAVTIRLKS